MDIRFAEASDLAAVQRFNDRLKAAGHEEQITLRPSLPGEARHRPEGFPAYRRMMIAEDGQEVRAALLLYHGRLMVRQRMRDCCWLDMPISEGVIDRKYSLCLIKLIKTALENQPFLMSLGAGPKDKDSFKLVTRMGWKHCAVPFFFYPVKVTNVLLGMRYIQRRSKLRVGARLGAYSGLGAGASALLALRRRVAALRADYECSAVERFDDWADRIFDAAHGDYASAVRSDATTLNILYPPENHGYTRLRIRRNGADLGWVVVARKQMQGNPYFGDLQVGTIVDGFGAASEVETLAAAGLNHLAESGVDLVVANFSHAAWMGACRRAGMLTGPDSFYFFVSPGGAPLLDAGCAARDMHITRGQSAGMSGLI